MRLWSGGAVALVAVGILGSCGAPPPPPASIAEREWTAAELLREVRGRTDSLETLRAGLELSWPDPDTGELKSCGASLSYARPNRLRIRGTSAAFFTVFDLVVGEERVWLDVPRENFVVFGSRADAAWEELPLSPQALLIALLADPCVDTPCLEEELELAKDGGETRTIESSDWTMTLDHRTGLPLDFERTSDERLHISWADWGLRHGKAWPSRISIRVGEATESLQVRLGLLQPGRSLSEGTFRFEPDQDREVLTPAAARARWQRIRL
jgi:hypothetical protein